MYNAAVKLYIIGPRIDHSRVNAGQRRAGMITALTSEFNAAFDWAVIRLATYVPAGTTQPRLLFGTVSLIAKDRPRPFSGKGVERHPVGKGKWDKVFFRRTALSARDAVVWYRAAGQDGIKTPVEKSALVDAFKEARVDLGAEIEIAKRLLEISPRAANLGQAQIDTASELLLLA